MELIIVGIIFAVSVWGLRAILKMCGLYPEEETPNTTADWPCVYCSNDDRRKMATHWDQIEAEVVAAPPAAVETTKAVEPVVKPKRTRKKSAAVTTPEPKAVPTKKPRRPRKGS